MRIFFGGSVPKFRAGGADASSDEGPRNGRVAMEEVEVAHQRWTRRYFLKAAVGGAFALFARPVLAETQVALTVPQGRLSLVNTHTGERLEVTYRGRSGDYAPKAIDALNHILRCHYSNQATKMDIGVIEFLNAVDKKLGADNELHIISAFRSREYNQLLIRKGRGVIRHSLHLEGKAIDVRIPGVDLGTVRRVALSLEWGGVGYYPRSGFVHLDSGAFRFW